MNCGCDNVQVLDAENDPETTEFGEVSLAFNQVEVTVAFETQKSSSDYRFEYLYVDAFGEVNPGTVMPVVVTQTVNGFVVELTGAPPVTGYKLRWRVVVITPTDTTPVTVDAEESFRVALPTGPAGTLLVFFQNPRSTTDYGFNELRVENLDDNVNTQTPIVVQVCAKNLGSFRVAFSPHPPTGNYFLVGRTH